MSNATSTVDLAHSKDNRGPEILAVTGTFLGLTWSSVLLRCYVRVHLTHSFQIDDWLMLAAIAVFTANAAFFIAGVHYGLGKHNLAVPQDDRIQALKYQSLSIIVYIGDMALIKASIAVFLLRIAVKNVYKWILRTSLIIIVLWTTGIFLFNIFQCTPVAFQWDSTIPDGKCVPGDSLVIAAYAFSILAVLSDWLYALLPIPMLWNVKMNLQTKISVTFILSLGVIASVATLIRVKFLIELSGFDDILFSTTDAEIWTVIEPGLSITAASIVTLRPLLRAMRISGFSSADAYASDANGRPPNQTSQTHPVANGYMRSQELDDLPIRGVRTVITRGDGTKGLSPEVVTPKKGPIVGGIDSGRSGFGNSKSHEVLGREDEVSDIGSEDFIIQSDVIEKPGTTGVRKTSTVNVRLQ